MKVLCYVIALIMYNTKFVTSHHLNVGTVLFTKEDLNRKCWTNTDKMILTARRVMQGVLPDPDYLDFTKAGITTVLLDYIESCFELVHQSTNDGTQQIMYLALSDTFGGYLRSYILPPTKQAFYAGQIKYKEACKMFDLYDDLKEYLKTSGMGWSKPRKCNLKGRIKPLKITRKGCNTACTKLYFIEKSEKNDACGIEIEKKNSRSIQNPTENLLFKLSSQLLKSGASNRLAESRDTMKNNGETSLFKDLFREESSGPRLIANLEKIGFLKKKNKRRNANFLEDELPFTENLKHESSVNCSKSCPCSSTNEKSEVNNGMEQNQHSFIDKELIKGSENIKRVIIPLPVLDSEESPQVIGFPFKKNPLRNLMSRDSICILVRFYLTVIKCLAAKKVNKHDILCFNKQFQSWLKSHILPHLDDEKWYPAFGGVLRIEETIKSIGTGENENCDSTNDINFIFSEGFGFDNSRVPTEEYENIGTEENGSEHFSPVYLKFGIMLIVIIWIFAFCYCFLCSCSGNDKCNEGTNETDKKNKMAANNPFILQCLVRFFRKNCADEKKGGKGQCNDDRDMTIDMVEAPGDAQDKSETSEAFSSKSVFFRDEMKCFFKNKNVVMSAQINPPGKQPKDWKTHWPFVKFAEEFPVVKPPRSEDCTKSIRYEHFRDSSENKNEFETLWKKQRFNVQTSESHLENCNEQDVPRRMRDQDANAHNTHKLSRFQRKFTSSSSFSNNKTSEEDYRKKVLFVKRSPSGHDYRSGYRSSYNTSANSYTTSQIEDELPNTQSDRIKDFKGSDQNSTTEFNQESESPMETDRDSTSSSESGHYSLSKPTS